MRVIENHPQLTAIHRKSMSAPLQWLVSRNLVKSPVIDFGSGHGEDTRQLLAMGFKAVPYDPFYCPMKPKGKFKTVLCIYVLNVLESVQREHVIDSCINLIENGGSAYFAVRRDIEKEGFRGQKGRETYQVNVVLESPFELYYLSRKFAVYRYKKESLS